MAQPPKAGAPKNSNNLLIGVGVLIIILLAFAFLKPDNGEVIPLNGDGDSAPADEVDAPNTATNFDYMLRSDWDGLERAERNIQSLGEGQVIESGIIQDPTDSNIVYFASSSFDAEKIETFNSIYKYDNNDYTFERIYQGTFGTENQLRQDGWFFNGVEWSPKFGVIGYDSENLVLIVTPHNSDNSCGEFIIPGPGHQNFFTLSIDKPYDGFTRRDFSSLDEELTRSKIDNCRQ